MQGSEGAPASAGMEASAGTRREAAARPAGLVVVAVLALLIAACSSGGPAANNAQSAQNAAKAKASAAAADVKITPGERGQGGRPIRRDHRHRGPRHAEERDRAHLRRVGDREPQPGRQDLAQPVVAGHRAALHGDRHGQRGRQRDRDHGEQLPHADPQQRVPHPDLRGLPADLRGRHAHHADLQPADHQPGRGRALAAADDLAVRWWARGTGTTASILPSGRRITGRPAPG